MTAIHEVLNMYERHLLYSPCKDLGRLTPEVGLLWTSDQLSQRLHRTTQHRNTKTNMYASSGIRTHDPSNQSVKTYTLDSAATVTGYKHIYLYILCIIMPTVITRHTFIIIIP
jgi:hypothetical protein